MPNTTKPTRPRQKAVYRIRNWSTYDRALVQRGSLTIWISAEVRRAWCHVGLPQRGAQFEYSAQAIEAMLTIKEIFHLSNRATEGFVRSLFEGLKLKLTVPDHTTLSRRSKTLKVHLPKRARGALQLVLDSSGLKVYGEGEWKVRQHGWSKRRTWLKFHVGIDPDSGEVQAAMLSEAGMTDADMVAPLLAQVENPITRVTADGIYDQREVYRAIQARAPSASILIPPRRGARIWRHGNTEGVPHPRDETVRFIRSHGRRSWKEESGYHQRSLAETAVFRFKTLFDEHLSARQFATQATQFGIRCRALNMMTHLGMPDSYQVA